MTLLSVERYAELLEGVGAENVDDFSACDTETPKDPMILQLG